MEKVFLLIEFKKLILKAIGQTVNYKKERSIIVIIFLLGFSWKIRRMESVKYLSKKIRLIIRVDLRMGYIIRRDSARHATQVKIIYTKVNS
jgi:hypothetical protein